MLSSYSGAVDDRVLSSPKEAVLGRLSEPGVLGCVWERETAPAVAGLRDLKLPSRSFEDGLIVWSHDYRERDLEELVRGLEAGHPRDVIIADARALLGRWFESAPRPHAFISLSVVADAGCHRLHVDRVGRRLLVTYAGAGTEWLEPAAAAEWRRDKCCWSPRAIQRVATGHVLLMKGCGDDPEQGLVHRAPPWTPGSEPRLLLRICDGEYHLAREAARAPRLGLPLS
ncbi:MAG: DUF1826 domain-containing protein [Labilithrix sp.]